MLRSSLAWVVVVGLPTSAAARRLTLRSGQFTDHVVTLGLLFVANPVIWRRVYPVYAAQAGRALNRAICGPRQENGSRESLA